MALRLGGALGTFWSKRRHFNEGQAFLERALAASEGVVTSARAKALWAAGWLAWVIFISQGDIATVRSLIAEGQAVFQELGVRAHLRLMLDLSAEVAFHEGDVDTARALTEESLALSRAMKEGYTIEALSVLARVSAFQGNHATARALYEEILAKAREFSDQLNIAFALEGLASVVVLQGEPTWAARLWGTAAALREALGAPLPPVYHSGYERSIIAARTQLGEKTFAIAWAEGHAMTLDEVLAAQRAALVPMPDPTRQSSPSPAKLAATYPDDLTAREVEVLRLLAQGLTDAQIAEQPDPPPPGRPQGIAPTRRESVGKVVPSRGEACPRPGMWGRALRLARRCSRAFQGPPVHAGPPRHRYFHVLLA